jgi:hypothetical protein
VAAAIGRSVRVYGSKNADDVTDFAVNGSELVDVTTLSGHKDAAFLSIQTAGQEETFLGVGEAAALFNAAASYRSAYPHDSWLVFTGGSTASGVAAVDSNGVPLHHSHKNGANIDLRYMGSDGRSLIGVGAADAGDITRNTFIIGNLGAWLPSLGAALTGNPARYGLGPISATFAERT